jgi:hypothetical protein
MVRMLAYECKDVPEMDIKIVIVTEKTSSNRPPTYRGIVEFRWV